MSTWLLVFLFLLTIVVAGVVGIFFGIVITIRGIVRMCGG